MRFKTLEVRNYKGIARVTLSDMSNEGVVVISGRNGTGKSLLLEALVSAWSGRYVMQERVGPWGDQLRVELWAELTDEEWQALETWRDRFNPGSPIARTDELRLAMTADRIGGQSTQMSPAMQILRNTTFQREHPFAVVDFLPANRLVPSAPSATVDLGMLNIERVEQERYQMLDQFINARNPMALPSVSNYLVTLDYQGFLAARQGLTVENEYERLQGAFKAATGKGLLLPEFDPSRGSNIEVVIPTGHRHGLRDLSSGEQEMLAMMYFVRRLSAVGGVLCIDEPEQHLHPSLQASLFEAMQGLANRAQVFVVSHSVNLISAAPLSGLVEIEAPTSPEAEQASRLVDVPARVELMAELGITGADLAQSDIIIVVEGETDAQWLRTLFPTEFGRAHIVAAGSANQVMDAHDTLSKIGSTIPWICLRDRDLLSDEEAAALLSRYENLFVWPRRAIESMLLDSRLVAETMRSVGKDIVTSAIETWMRTAAELLKDEVLAGLVDAQLTRKFPAPGAQSSLERFARMESELRAYAEVNRARADNLAAVLAEQRVELDSRWASEWQKLVNPKPVLEQLRANLGSFRSSQDFVSAMMAKARDDASVRPAGLEELRLAVAARLD